MAEEKPQTPEELKLEGEEVEIISEEETELLDENLRPYKAIIITWRFRDFPPQVTIIKADEYSEDKLKELIKQRIQQLLKRTRRTIRL